MLAVLGVCAFIGFFVLGLYAWSHSAQEDYGEVRRTFEEFRRDEKERERLLDEMDAWRMPETVMLWSRSDQQDFDTSVTRYFVPTEGVDVQRAAEDLVAALRAQGCENLANTGDDEWQGDCRATSSCQLWIKIKAADNRISIMLAAA